MLPSSSTTNQLQILHDQKYAVHLTVAGGATNQADRNPETTMGKDIEYLAYIHTHTFKAEKGLI